jgi:hypothetical protein
MDSGMFEQLAKSSSKTMKTLHSTAIKQVKEKNNGIVKEALDNMQRSYKHCNASLPKRTTPEV